MASRAPSACGTVREVGTLSHALPGDLRVDKPDQAARAEQLWNLPPGRINPKVGYHTVEMWEKFCTAGGDIDIESREGQGTRVTIYLPLVEKKIRLLEAPAP